jgi:hypothetical protein
MNGFLKWTTLALLIVVGAFAIRHFHRRMYFFMATRTSASAVDHGNVSPPICGISRNINNLIPNAAAWTGFTSPPVGSTYTDPGGYCPVTRVTNFVGSPSCGAHYYATKTPFDSSDSYLLLFDCNTGGWFMSAGPKNGLYSVGKIIFTEAQLGDLWSHASEPTWDRNTPGVFWATLNDSIEKCTVNNSAKKIKCVTNHTFSEYAGYRINFMDETDISPDGWLATVGQNVKGGAIDIFLWNPTTLAKSPVYTTSCKANVDSANNDCLHKLIAAPVEGIIVGFADNGSSAEQGNRLWQAPWTTPLPYIQNQTGHLDTGEDPSGNQVYATEDPLDNPGPFGTCVHRYRPALLQFGAKVPDGSCMFDDPGGNPGWHLSWRDWPASQFVAFSAQANRSTAECFNNAPCYAAPSSKNWSTYLGEIVLVAATANNDTAYIYRLALTHARGNPGYFWSDPRAAESYDGAYIAFDSNAAWSATGCGTDGGGSCNDVYIIQIH